MLIVQYYTVQYQEVQHQMVGYWYSATLIVQCQNSVTVNSAASNSGTSNRATLK